MDNISRAHRPKNYFGLIIALLFLWGALVCLRYGRIGLMPLDQSIVFDGGWRILSGQVPFRDFYTPNGLVPIYIQSLFFLVFGVNWLAYCLHAAVFNGLFCVLAYGVLRSVAGAKWLSIVYAVLNGLVFYPPFGVPYMDQHAFFFILLAFYFILRAYRSQSMSSKIPYWIFTSLAMILAFLSKQIPTVFAAVFLSVLLLTTTPKKQIMRMVLICFASLATASGIFAVAALLVRVDFWQMKHCVLVRPSKIGHDRFISILNKYSGWQILKGLFYPLPSIPMAFRLRLFSLINLSALMILSLSLLYRNFKETLRKSTLLPEVLNNILMAYALLLTCNIFVLLTLNQGENGLPYIFVCLGIMHVATLKVLPARAMSKYQRFFKYAISAIFICVAMGDAFQFNDKANRARLVHEMDLDPQPLHWEKMPDGLGFMDFHLCPNYRYIYSRLALMEAVEYLKKRGSNFFLVGDTAILYGLARRPSLNPCLWFHPGYSMPDFDTEEFHEYEELVMANIRGYKARYLVLEGENTWFNVSLGSFEGLGSLIVENSPENRVFRQIKIFRIDPNRLD